MRCTSTLLTAIAAGLIVPQAVMGLLFITAPTDGTTCPSGSSCQLTWNDSPDAPTLAQIGLCTVGIYAGNSQQQTLLQDLGSVDVSKAASLSYTPNGSIGPNTDIYFIRFTSANLKDTTNTAFPYQGFSHKFALSGMSGTFNATVQAQVDGASSVSGSASATGSASVSATGASASATATGSSASSSASASASASGLKAAASTSGSKTGTATASAGTSTPSNGAAQLGSGAALTAVAAVAAGIFGWAF